MGSPRKSLLRNSRGQSLVEFAILIPLILIFLVGVIEWGFVLWTQTTFVNAARDGARFAVVIQDWNINAGVRTVEVRNIVADRVSSLPDVLKSNIKNHVNVEILPSTLDPQSIKVTISNQPYSPILGLGLVPVPAALSASSEFRFEGVR